MFFYCLEHCPFEILPLPGNDYCHSDPDEQENREHNREKDYEKVCVYQFSSVLLFGINNINWACWIVFHWNLLLQKQFGLHLPSPKACGMESFRWSELYTASTFPLPNNSNLFLFGGNYQQNARNHIIYQEALRTKYFRTKQSRK